MGLEQLLLLLLAAPGRGARRSLALLLLQVVLRVGGALRSETLAGGSLLLLRVGVADQGKLCVGGTLQGEGNFVKAGLGFVIHACRASLLASEWYRAEVRSRWRRCS